MGALETRTAADGSTCVHLHLKVVPAASRAGLVGLLGARLKLRVSQPPESGKANKAVLALLAERLGVPVASLSLVRGASTPRKTVAVEGLAVDEVRARLGL